MRFSYDSTKIQPSNLSTNAITNDELEYFKFETEFQYALEMFTIDYDGQGDGIRAIISFKPPVEESEHIIEKDGIGKIVNTDGGVLLGKMSFQMTADVFDVSWFSLEEVKDTSPQTGIKINIDGSQFFEDQSTFRFTDRTASKDSSLSNLIVSTGVVDETQPENSTYKEYGYTPTFDKDTLNYELELQEYIDNMNIKAITTDDKATMKIKVPKRNENNELVYDTDGSTIIYEEKDIESDVPFEITLNKLGEPDTKITIVVTAEDGNTVSSYELVIKRPYGIIKGSISTSPTASTTGINKATIRIYKSDDVSSIIDWSTTVSGGTDDVHDKLLTLESQNYITNDDGTYEIYVIPGTYDILLDKTGYLDHIYITKTVNEGITMDLGNKELIPGDINKDGSIQILDLSELMNVFGIYNTDSNYNLKYDFNEDGEVQILDLSFIMSNFSETRKVE